MIYKLYFIGQRVKHIGEEGIITRVWICKESGHSDFCTEVQIKFENGTNIFVQQKDFEDIQDIQMHYCEVKSYSDSSHCQEQYSGVMLFYIDEDCTQVNYCPLCGTKAKVQRV